MASNPLLQIPSRKLDENYFFLHKKETVETGFGLDHTTQLFESAFGIYSCAKLKEEISPLKTNFYRIALCVKGALEVEIGLERFVHSSNTIHFTSPGQIFSFKNKSADLEAFYIMFTQSFIEEILTEFEIQHNYPFFNFLQTPFFWLDGDESILIQKLLNQISEEVRLDRPDNNRLIKLSINAIFIEAKRSYLRQGIERAAQISKGSELVSKFKRLVAQRFFSQRSISAYAKELTVSVSHLQKTVKEETGKNPRELIDDMLVMEIKALLRHSALYISEIALQLQFTDTSHLSKFFKKYAGVNPTDYRNGRFSF